MIPKISKASVAAQGAKITTSLRIEFQCEQFSERGEMWFLRFRNLQPSFCLKKKSPINSYCCLMTIFKSCTEVLI